MSITKFETESKYKYTRLIIVIFLSLSVSCVMFWTAWAWLQRMWWSELVSSSIDPTSTVTLSDQTTGETGSPSREHSDTQIPTQHLAMKKTGGVLWLQWNFPLTSSFLMCEPFYITGNVATFLHVRNKPFFLQSLILGIIHSWTLF